MGAHGLFAFYQATLAALREAFLILPLYMLILFFMKRSSEKLKSLLQSILKSLKF